MNNSAFYHQIFTTLNQILESEDESFLIAYDGGQILLNQAEITHHDDELLVFEGESWSLIIRIFLIS